LDFHLAAGLWLLSIAVGRRLFGEAPWGIKIYTNLYLMLIADTTYYRKSTAYKLAEQIAREAIPHMLMPTPGSPERFQEALAGRMPANFDKLTKPQQERLTKAQPFAAQRGLLKDEVAGLFGAINKREYMVGMKDLLMELYDCPEYSDKDTQAGLTIVENAALSILGVTTPAGLAMATSDADWANGLLIRFALLTPEPDYRERPALKTFQPPPKALVEGLRRLHEKLPAPSKTDTGLVVPGSLQLKVECWEACQAYSQTLRQLCHPQRDLELDERLKGVYGRMHVQAFKLAALLAALDWLETDEPTPIVTERHWASGQAIAEHWRGSAARLLQQMDRSGEAVMEQRDQSKLLALLRKSAQHGMGLRDLYHALNLPAKRARQLAQDLVKAGLIVERLYGRAEWYVAVEFIAD
jgi:predicted transcriptional regulator